MLALPLQAGNARCKGQGVFGDLWSSPKALPWPELIYEQESELPDVSGSQVHLEVMLTMSCCNMCKFDAPAIHKTTSCRCRSFLHWLAQSDTDLCPPATPKDRSGRRVGESEESASTPHSTLPPLLSTFHSGPKAATVTRIAICRGPSL